MLLALAQQVSELPAALLLGAVPHKVPAQVPVLATQRAIILALALQQAPTLVPAVRAIQPTPLQPRPQRWRRATTRFPSAKKTDACVLIRRRTHSSRGSCSSRGRLSRQRSCRRHEDAGIDTRSFTLAAIGAGRLAAAW